MKKIIRMVAMLLLVALLAACGRGDPDAVQQANEGHDPVQQRLDEGNIQAIMDQTKGEFSRSDVNFFTYRMRDGQLRMNAHLLNEEIEEEFVQTFVDAFRNSQADSIQIDLTGRGTYEIPLNEEVTDFQEYFTPED